MATKRAAPKKPTKAKTKAPTKPRVKAGVRKAAARRSSKPQLPAVKPGSMILVHFVERQLEGWTFSREHWPLHILLVSWFTSEDEEAVFRSLERLSADTSPLVLQVGAEENFGIKANIPVNVIKNNAPIKKLHENMLATLEGADFTLQESRFIRSDYRAHITRYPKDGRQSNEGERVLVNDFHLVRLLDETTCIVEQAFDLIKR